MAAPTITLAPSTGPAGTVVTVTVVRDLPATSIEVTATTPLGVGTATFSLVEALEVVAASRDLTVVSDDGTTWVGTFIA